MKYIFIIGLILLAVVLMITSNKPNTVNNSDKRMRELRLIKKKKAKEREELNRSKMKAVA